MSTHAVARQMSSDFGEYAPRNSLLTEVYGLFSFDTVEK
jgi:hypothetical protein